MSCDSASRREGGHSTQWWSRERCGTRASNRGSCGWKGASTAQEQLPSSGWTRRPRARRGRSKSAASRPRSISVRRRDAGTQRLLLWRPAARPAAQARLAFGRRAGASGDPRTAAGRDSTRAHVGIGHVARSPGRRRSDGGIPRQTPVACEAFGGAPRAFDRPATIIGVHHHRGLAGGTLVLHMDALGGSMEPTHARIPATLPHSDSLVVALSAHGYLGLAASTHLVGRSAGSQDRRRDCEQGYIDHHGQGSHRSPFRRGSVCRSGRLAVIECTVFSMLRHALQRR
jgi:hypothetical protein